MSTRFAGLTIINDVSDSDIIVDGVIIRRKGDPPFHTQMIPRQYPSLSPLFTILLLVLITCNVMLPYVENSTWNGCVTAIVVFITYWAGYEYGKSLRSVTSYVLPK